MGTFLGILLIVTIVLSKVVSKKLADAGEGRMPGKSVGRKLSDPFPMIEIPPAPLAENTSRSETQADVLGRDEEFMEVLQRYAGAETAGEPVVEELAVAEEIGNDAAGESPEESLEDVQPAAAEMNAAARSVADETGNHDVSVGKKNRKLEIDPKKMVIYSEIIRPKYLE